MLLSCWLVLLSGRPVLLAGFTVVLAVQQAGTSSSPHHCTLGKAYPEDATLAGDHTFFYVLLLINPVF